MNEQGDRAVDSSRDRTWRFAAAEVVTVGLPFCVFKFFSGLVAIRTPMLAAVGYLLMLIAIVDLVFNVINLLSLAFAGRRAAPICFTDLVVRRVARKHRESELGIALDVFLSFALVAIAISIGMHARLPTWGAPIWSVAVVFNVLGAGVGRLFSALSRRA